MFDPRIKRIWWKEYRTQRVIWMALVIGTMALQALRLIDRHDHSEFLRTMPFALSLVLTWLFAITSLGIAFAGEHEEKTWHWLRMLPTDRWPVLWAKLSSWIVGTLAFAVVTLSSAALFNVVARSPQPSIAFNLHDSGFAFIVLSCLGGCLWGLLFTLLSRNVMYTLLLTAGAQTFLYAGLLYFFGTPAWEYWIVPLHVVICILLLIADILLLQQWLVRNVSVRDLWPWRALGVSPMSAHSQTTSSPALAPSDSSQGQTAQGQTTRVIPHGADAQCSPVMRWNLRTLSHVMTSRTALGRQVGVLAWRELRSVVPYLLCGLAVGLVMIGCQRPLFVGFPANMMVLFLLPLIAGLLAAGNEQPGEHQLFLHDRGVSPALVWIVKQSVWFGAALLLGGGLLGFDHWLNADLHAHYLRGRQPMIGGVWESIQAGITTSLTFRLRYINGSSVSVSPALREEALRLQQVMLVTMGLGLFAIGQLAGFVCRLRIVAFTLAIVAGVFLLTWQWMMTRFDVPLARSTWPWLIIAFSATYLLRTRWMAARHDRFTQLLRAGCVLGGLLLAIGLTIHWRVTQIPQFDPGFDWQAHRRAMDDVDYNWQQRWYLLSPRAERAVRHAEALRNEESKRNDESTPADIESIGEADGGIDMSNGAMSVGGRMSNDRLLPLKHYLTFTDQVVAMADELDTSSVQFDATEVWDRIETRMFTPLEGLLVSIEHHIDNDRLDEAWEELAAAHKLHDALSKQTISWTGWYNGLHIFDRLSFLTTRWANHPDQTEARLQQAADERALTSILPTTQEMMENRYVLNRSALEQRTTDDFDFGGTDPASSLWYTLTGERARVIRLLSADMSVQTSDDEQLRETLEPFIQRWARTTAVNLSDGPNGVQIVGTLSAVAASSRTVTVDNTFFPAVSARQATLIVIALQRYRLKHGEFPQELYNLTPEFLPHLISDALSRLAFQYRRGGFESPVLTSRSHVVAADQPLLWSVGRPAGHIGWNDSDEPVRFSRDAYFPVPGRWFHATNIEFPTRTGGEQFNPTDRDFIPPTAQPQTIEFVILGRR